MAFYIIPDKEALGRCAWCRSPISEDAEVFGFGAKLRPDVDLTEYERHCIEIDLASGEKTVYMTVTAQGSEARTHGNDCMFLVCSKECTEKLKAALEKEIALGKMFETFQNEQT